MFTRETVLKFMRNKYVLFAFVIAIAGIFAATMFLQQQQAIGEETAEGAPKTEAGQYWGKRCNKDDTSYCEAFQTVTVTKTSQKLLEFALGYPKDQKGAQGVIVLPLGFIMTDGIGLQLDEGKTNKAMVRFCNQSGCYVYMNLPESFVTGMTKGQQMSVYFLDGTGKKVRIQMPLEGFGDTLAQIRP